MSPSVSQSKFVVGWLPACPRLPGPWSILGNSHLTIMFKCELLGHQPLVTPPPTPRLQDPEFADAFLTSDFHTFAQCPPVLAFFHHHPQSMFAVKAFLAGPPYSLGPLCPRNFMFKLNRISRPASLPFPCSGPSRLSPPHVSCY